MLQKSARANLIYGLGSDLIEGGVISLRYAYDTILFIGKIEIYTRNLKWILTFFEMMSGMRINYHKNELVPVNILETKELQMFLIYLGVLWGPSQSSILESHCITRS
jgi:hypothetical protein